MSPTTFKRPGPSPLRRTLFFLGALPLGAILALAILVPLGLVKLPFLSKPTARPRGEGIPVPLTVHAIQAYTRITRDHVLDAQTGDLLVTYLRPEDVKDKGLLPFDKIIG